MNFTGRLSIICARTFVGSEKERQEDAILKACTGLEGGIVAAGSTCGVVTAGVLGLACDAAPDLLQGDTAAEKAVMERAARYVRWFEDTYGSSFCRARTGVNFYSKAGQLRYLVPGDKVIPCLLHIRGAMRYLFSNRLPEGGQDENRPSNPPPDTGTTPVHCASAVLEGIRRQTGIGNPRLERMAFVLDGGAALSGGGCGALVGAVMAVNLVLGLPVRQLSYGAIIGAFARGHANLLRKKNRISPEPFAVGRKVVSDFQEMAGGIECRDITGRSFSDWDAFQAYMAETPSCAGLIRDVTAQTSETLRSFGDLNRFNAAY